MTDDGAAGDGASRAAVTLRTGASINGRLLEQTAVSIDASTVVHELANFIERAVVFGTGEFLHVDAPGLAGDNWPRRWPFGNGAPCRRDPGHRPVDALSLAGDRKGLRAITKRLGARGSR